MILDNSPTAWITALVVTGAVFLGLSAIRGLLVNRLGARAAQTKTRADDIIVALARRTRYFFLLLLAVAVGSLALRIDGVTRARGQLVLQLALLLQVAMWLDGLVQAWIESYTEKKAETDAASATTISALSYAARFAVWVAVALVALDTLNVRVTALITGLGVTGIAVALAVQNILGDLFGALSIILDKPFVVGDSIQLDNMSGTVEHIGLKTTRLRSVTGEQLIISNSDLLKGRIRNFKRLAERRNLVVTTLSAKTPSERLTSVPGLIQQVVSAVPNVRLERSHLRGMTFDGYEYETVYWVTTPAYATFMDAQQAVIAGIAAAMRREKLQLSFRGPDYVVINSEKGSEPGVEAGGQSHGSDPP